MWLSEGWGKNPKDVQWNKVVKVAVGRYWELRMRLQKIDVWSTTKKKRERLKGVFV